MTRVTLAGTVLASTLPVLPTAPVWLAVAMRCEQDRSPVLAEVQGTPTLDRRLRACRPGQRIAVAGTLRLRPAWPQAGSAPPELIVLAKGLESVSAPAPPRVTLRARFEIATITYGLQKCLAVAYLAAASPVQISLIAHGHLAPQLYSHQPGDLLTVAGELIVAQAATSRRSTSFAVELRFLHSTRLEACRYAPPLGALAWLVDETLPESTP
jgi:hypothetical protein